MLIGAALAAAATKATGWGAVVVAGLARGRGPAATAASGPARRYCRCRWDRTAHTWPAVVHRRPVAGWRRCGRACWLDSPVSKLSPRVAPEKLLRRYTNCRSLAARLLWRLPVNYVLAPGGLSETFRTFWVQPDYVVPAISGVRLSATMLLVLVAVAGGLWLAFGARGAVPLRRTHRR